jgi:Ser/Thr protein kinase RdoA (MazF antagonist)
MVMNSRVNLQIRKVARKYGLKITKLTPCSSYYKDNAAYKADTKEGAFLIKPFIGSLAKLRKFSAHVQQLDEKHYRNMPAWRKSIDGSTWIRHKDKLYYVTDWIDGHPLGETEHDYKRLGKALAKLHTIRIRVDNWKSRNALKEVNKNRRQHDKFSRKFPALQEENSEQGIWYRLNGSHLKSLATEAWKILNKSSIVRKIKHADPVLIHGDITIPNIINSSKRLYLIDWESCRIGSIYYEISRTLTNTTQFSTVRINAFLTEYMKYRPLDKQEKMIISALFRMPREVWNLGLQSNRGNSSALYQIVRNSWTDRLEAIKWVDNWAKK